MHRRWMIPAALALVVCLTSGWYLQGRLSRDDLYHQARLFEAVLTHVRDYYVDTIPESRLYDHATEGLLAQLRDPYAALLRGRIRIHGGRSGVTIERFKGYERFGHWLLATSFILLALSGLARFDMARSRVNTPYVTVGIGGYAWQGSASAQDAASKTKSPSSTVPASPCRISTWPTR